METQEAYQVCIIEINRKTNQRTQVVSGRIFVDPSTEILRIRLGSWSDADSGLLSTPAPLFVSDKAKILANRKAMYQKLAACDLWQ